MQILPSGVLFAVCRNTLLLSFNIVIASLGVNSMYVPEFISF
jgi:hypothetical protein